jgi:prepilin-type N-terminal cleavage/methylation domain-containing protein
MKKLNNKGFSLIELLVAIVVISLSLIALLNTFVFFLSSRVKYTVAMDSLLAARYLALNLTKLENTLGEKFRKDSKRQQPQQLNRLAKCLIDASRYCTPKT